MDAGKEAVNRPEVETRKQTLGAFFRAEILGRARHFILNPKL